MSPSIKEVSLEKLCLAAAMLADARIEFNIHRLLSAMPLSHKLKAATVENAVEQLILTKESISLDPFVYSATDTGNKFGNKALSNFCCWYCPKSKSQTYMLDCDCVDKSTEDIFSGLHHSLTRFFDETSVQLHGQCTDSSGGGAKFALAAKVKRVLMQGDLYLISTCTLYNVQTALHDAVEHILGEGSQDENGDYKMNVMQMLHGAYNLQNWKEFKELTELWIYLSSVSDADKNIQEIKQTHPHTLV
eukprot:5791584-Ditylum_brightwellii.AAC.1